MDLETTGDVALLILRVAFGITLALHGIGKLRNVASTGAWFSSIGLRPGKFHARLAGGTELSAGLGLALGLLTPLTCLAYIGVMTTAGWVGHRKSGFSSAKNGWEHVFGLAIVAVVVSLIGPGEISLDSLIHQEWFELLWLESEGNRWGAFIFSTAGGVLMSVLTLLTFYRPNAMASPAEASETEASPAEASPMDS